MYTINKNNLHKERLGETKINSQGIEMRICEYHNCKDMWVEFQDENKVKVHCSYERFQQGKVRNPNSIHPATFSSRLGETNYNTQGCKMTIIKYNTANDLIVEFENGYKAHGAYKEFRKGTIKNLYHPNVVSIGFVGKKYPVSDGDGKDSKEYMTWYNMLTRCYNEKFKQDFPVYKDSCCCKEWLNFENFYEWLYSQENFDTWKQSYKSALDKDIIVKNNKVYSPETCVLVPHNINCLFTKSDIVRGNLPIGTCLNKDNGQYVVHCCNGYKKSKYLGSFSTIEEAFEAYKTYKEKLIKEMAIKAYNKGEISKRCFDAMNNYIVEFED